MIDSVTDSVADSVADPESAGNLHPGSAPRSTRVGMREARARLASLVRRAGEGERIVLTVDGRAVAQLGPIEADPDERTLDDLIARGLLQPARREDRPPEPDLRIDSWTGGRLDRALREVRGA